MIEYTKEQVTEIKSIISERAPKYGYDLKGDDLIPNSLPLRSASARINMFLAIGINSTGRCMSFISIRDFVRKGINRFFLSLQNRKDLDIDVLKNNKVSGKYLICADFYIGPACFDCVEVPDEIIDQWNVMMRNLRIREKHGIQCIKVYSPKDENTVKYQWFDRPTKK